MNASWHNSAAGVEQLWSFGLGIAGRQDLMMQKMMPRKSVQDIFKYRTISYCYHK
jgi:hypothetical protein